MSNLEIGKTALEDRRFSDAASALAVALSADQDADSVLGLLERFLVDLDANDDALPLFRLYLDHDQTNAEIHYKAGTIFERQSKLVPAYHHYRRVVHLRPDHLYGHLRLGKVASTLGYFTEAEFHLNWVMTRSPELYKPHEYLVDTYLGLDRIDDARVALSRAMSIHPGATALDEERRAKLQKRINKHAKRDTGVSDREIVRYPERHANFDDIRAVIREYVLGDYNSFEPKISQHSKLITIGSCFAGNVATSLKKRNYDVLWKSVAEDFNTTFANRYLVDYIKTARADAINEVLRELLGEDRDILLERIRESDVLIFTVGVAPCFFDVHSGEYRLVRSAREITPDLVFRTTSVQENVDNLKHIFETVRSINPDISIVYTVSPVPLLATLEFQSAVIADCISKSVLRVAAHEISKLALPNTYYWPSFEIVRWIGSHTGPVFGVDGNSHHVDQDLIDTIMDVFLEVFSDNVVLLSSMPQERRASS